ncbi:hypothetical protein JIN84_14940 [Luteolibacter yonseiensis]|uniref:Bacterial Pleckstrin homology domain-containing protein n=1 Tax=Luteolibacter yonseiensis TaxID=1144680 RepID=A0A934VC91_9BACT|nr:PH domain-containing protein [Luteolibacter yonseiensis]MBK1816920.1 hypothetical protein [Luteolibacter yonseiensis]
MKTYKAPWGTALKVISGFLVLLTIGLVAGPLILPDVIPRFDSGWLLPVFVAALLPFMVLGYEVTEEAILIRRPFWKTRLSRKGLMSATVEPRAMSRSIRTCGNGGGFSFTGWYWKSGMGTFRAYVTDLDRTVVLRFEKRTVVVSPGEPEDFVDALSKGNG